MLASAGAAIALLLLYGARSNADAVRTGTPQKTTNNQIDPPLWNAQARLTAQTGPAAYDYFGGSVAISGDRVIVGAVEDYPLVAGSHLGSAYILVRTGSDWTEQKKLIPSDGVSFARFGWSVAISGDTAIVGAPFGGDQRGKAYVYVFQNGQWNEQAKLEASLPTANDRFGYSVAISGDTAVVGSYPLGAGRTQGAAYVFSRSGGTWSAATPLVASQQAAGTIFGFSVAISGDTAVVAAAGKDGAAHMFVRSGSSWIQQGPKLARSGSVDNDFFGDSVAVSGDTAVVQFQNNLNVGGIRGAYFYFRSGQTWSEQQHILEPRADSKLGRVGVSGETAVIGTSIYVRSNGAWSEQTKLTVNDGDAADSFGTVGVGISGETAIVGANGTDINNAVNRGAAYVFPPLPRHGWGWFAR